jgi:hypothetical protein
MNLDHKILGGMFIGIVLGLHYHAALVSFLPILMIFAVIMVLRLVLK